MSSDASAMGNPVDRPGGRSVRGQQVREHRLPIQREPNAVHEVDARILRGVAPHHTPRAIEDERPASLSSTRCDRHQREATLRLIGGVGRPPKRRNPGGKAAGGAGALRHPRPRGEQLHDRLLVGRHPDQRDGVLRHRLGLHDVDGLLAEGDGEVVGARRGGLPAGEEHGVHAGGADLQRPQLERRFARWRSLAPRQQRTHHQQGLTSPFPPQCRHAPATMAPARQERANPRAPSPTHSLRGPAPGATTFQEPATQPACLNPP